MARRPSREEAILLALAASLAFPETAEPPATEQWTLMAFITATKSPTNHSMNSRKPRTSKMTACTRSTEKSWARL
jgi:hypothetical protein